MTYTCLIAETQGSIRYITLNRPAQHNAFNEVVIAELTDAYTQAGADPAVRVVVLKGAGSSFCAGADLLWMGRMVGFSHEENLADSRALQGMFAAIAGCPKVTIAQVHGAAIGGGAGLVAVCDMAIVAQGALFALSEVRLGLVPAVIAPYVVEKIGMGAARALFVTGERFNGAEAFRIGLAQQVTAAEALPAAVQRTAELVGQTGPEAVATAKRLLRDIAGKTPEQAANITIECIAALRVSAEGQEGIHAFLEKRKPNFTGG
jgi:methylglutaconyl-CoA hydratase